MLRARRVALLPLLGILGACDPSAVPFLWKTYRHPTHRFEVRVPRTWEVLQDGFAGSAVMFRERESDPSFRTNVTFVVEPLRKKIALQGLVDLSEKQLAVLFNRYQRLARAASTLGPLPAVELRGRYLALEGSRIVRSVIALAGDTQVILTFSCREEREADYAAVFEGVRNSFVPPGT